MFIPKFSSPEPPYVCHQEIRRGSPHHNKKNSLKNPLYPCLYRPYDFLCVCNLTIIGWIIKHFISLLVISGPYVILYLKYQVYCSLIFAYAILDLMTYRHCNPIYLVLHSYSFLVHNCGKKAKRPQSRISIKYDYAK